MAKGDAALISAILEGEGELRVVQTVVIPQKLLEIDKKNFMIPKFGPQGFEFKKAKKKVKLPWAMTKLKMKHTKVYSPTKLKKKGEPYGSKDNVVVTVDGKHNDSHDFLTGWTLTQGFEIHERWSFPSGHLEIRAGAAYATGVRVPVKVQARMSPTEIHATTTSKKLIKKEKVTLGFKAEAYNGNAQDYRNAGLPENQVLGGKEIPLQAGAYVSCSFRALWKTWIRNKDCRLGVDVDYSMEMQPPYAGKSLKIGRKNSALKSPQIWIPASATQTELNLGLGTVGAQLGVKLDGKSSVDLDYKFKVDKQTKVSKKLTFRNKAFQQQTYKIDGAPIGKTRRFGYTLGNPRYNITLYLIPGARLYASVKVSYIFDTFRRTWDHTMWFEDMKIPLAEGTLGPHAKTNTMYDMSEIGRQSTKKWKGSKILWACLEEVKKNGQSYKPKRFLGIDQYRNAKQSNTCGPRQYVQITGAPKWASGNPDRELQFGHDLLLASPVSSSVFYCPASDSFCGTTKNAYKVVPFSMKNMKDPRRRVRFAVLIDGYPQFATMAGHKRKISKKGYSLGLSGDYGMSTFKFVAPGGKSSSLLQNGTIAHIKSGTNGLYLTSSAKLYDPKKSGKAGIPRFKVHVKATTPPPLDYTCPKGWKFRTDAKKPYGVVDTTGPVCTKGKQRIPARIQK